MYTNITFNTNRVFSHPRWEHLEHGGYLCRSVARAADLYNDFCEITGSIDEITRSLELQANDFTVQFREFGNKIFVIILTGTQPVTGFTVKDCYHGLLKLDTMTGV